MKRKNIEAIFLDKLAARAKERQPKVQLPPGFRDGVMQEITALQNPQGFIIKSESNINLLASLSLRFAGAACFVACAVSLYAIFYGPDLDLQAAELYMNYSVMS